MTDKEILNLAQAELRTMYKRIGINGSNVLDLIDEALRQPLVSGSLPLTKCKCGQNALPYKAQIEIDKCSRCGNDR